MEGICKRKTFKQRNFKLPGTSSEEFLPRGGGRGRITVCDRQRLGGLSNLMDVYEELGIPVDEEIIHEFLRHEDVAEDVSAYFDLYKNIRTIMALQRFWREK